MVLIVFNGKIVIIFMRKCMFASNESAKKFNLEGRQIQKITSKIQQCNIRHSE